MLGTHVGVLDAGYSHLARAKTYRHAPGNLPKEESEQTNREDETCEHLLFHDNPSPHLPVPSREFQTDREV